MYSQLPMFYYLTNIEVLSQIVTKNYKNKDIYEENSELLSNEEKID
jgi:hypothetical protein